MTSLTYWKIEPKQVWWKFFVKNPNEKCNNFKVYFWKVPGVSLSIRQLDNLFEHLFLQFQVILIIVLFVTPTSDQTFGHSILINYDYNKSLFVLSCLWVYIVLAYIITIEHDELQVCVYTDGFTCTMCDLI